MRPDFVTSRFGLISPARWRKYWSLLNFLDLVYELRIARAVRRARRAGRGMPPQRILLVAVEVPGREKDLAWLVETMTGCTNQHVEVSIISMEKRGKFDNVNMALEARDLSGFEWLLIVDDDVAVPPGFLDLFFHLCRQSHLRIAQPAHRFNSYASYTITERHWGAMVRRTSFVEIGPVTAIHASLFAHLIPFPHLRYAWGLDILWAELARRQGWRLGVVDATPISHLRPVGQSYDMEAANAEAEDFLIRHGATSPRSVILGTNVKV
jgi:hypothetical protein